MTTQSRNVDVWYRILPCLKTFRFTSLGSFKEYVNNSLLPPTLQVDFGSLRKVTRVATQGASSFFVTRFQLKFSNNSIEWLDYTENGIVKVKLKISRRSDSFSQKRYRKIKRPFKFKREPNNRIHFSRL